MLFLLCGVGMVLWKLSEVGSPPDWSGRDWTFVLVPFGLAVAWWAWADSTGYTKRKSMEREDKRRQARIDKNKEAIGTLAKRKRH